MRSHTFFAGAVTGVALLVLGTALLLAGIGRRPVSAAGSPTAATDTVNQAEQRMMMPISDAEWNAAAAALGMTQADFADAIDGGQSVAAMGAPHQVSVDQVRVAMVTAGTAVVNTAAHDGTITQADASRLNAGIVTAIAAKVTHANTDDPAAGSGTSAPTGINNTVAAAEISALASTLGISLDEIKPLLDNPAELAAQAASRGVTARQLEETLTAAGQQVLDQAVAKGSLSQADANELRTSLVQPMAAKLSHGA